VLVPWAGKAASENNMTGNADCSKTFCCAFVGTAAGAMLGDAELEA